MRELFDMMVFHNVTGRLGRIVRGVAAGGAVFLGFFVLLVLLPSKKQLALDSGAGTDTGLSVAHADAPSSDSTSSDSTAAGDSTGSGDSSSGDSSSDSSADGAL